MRDAADPVKAGTKQAASQNAAPKNMRRGAPAGRETAARRSRSCRRRRTAASSATHEATPAQQSPQSPERAGHAADQIRHAPPGERLDALLHPGEQQEQASSAVTQVATTNNVPTSSDAGAAATLIAMTRHSILPGQSVFITGRNLAQAVCARGFAKRLVHVADFEKASRKETENASKLFVDCFRLCCSLPAIAHTNAPAKRAGAT